MIKLTDVDGKEFYFAKEQVVELEAAEGGGTLMTYSNNRDRVVPLPIKVVSDLVDGRIGMAELLRRQQPVCADPGCAEPKGAHAHGPRARPMRPKEDDGEYYASLPEGACTLAGCKHHKFIDQPVDESADA